MQKWLLTIILLFILVINTSLLSPLYIGYAIKGYTANSDRFYEIYDKDSMCRVSVRVYMEHYPSKKYGITFKMAIKNISNEVIDLDKQLIAFNDPAYHFSDQPIYQASRLQPGDSTFVYNHFLSDVKKRFKDLREEVAKKEFTFKITQLKAENKQLPYPELSIYNTTNN